MTSPHHTDSSPPEPRRPAGRSPDGSGVADDESDALIVMLSRAFDLLEPLPAGALAAARGAFAWRSVDAELAELLFDSASELTGVRDLDAARQLTFATADLEVELMVVDESARRLVGQLVPARPAAITLQSASIEVDAPADRLGRFSFEDVPTGPVRFAVDRGDSVPAVTTDWIVL